MLLNRFLSFLFIVASLGFVGCAAADRPEEGFDPTGTYSIEPEPNLRMDAYYFTQHKVDPSEDYSKYWSENERPALKEKIYIQRETTPNKENPLENLSITLWTTSGASHGVFITLQDRSDEGVALVDLKEEYPVDGCTYGKGVGIKLQYNDEFGDELTMKYSEFYAYVGSQAKPKACASVLTNLQNQMAAVQDPFLIEDPMWRLFVASKFIPLQGLDGLFHMEWMVVKKGTRISSKTTPGA